MIDLARCDPTPRGVGLRDLEPVPGKEVVIA